jgi:hypothetical protein
LEQGEEVVKKEVGGRRQEIGIRRRNKKGIRSKEQGKKAMDSKVKIAPFATI